MPAVLQEIQVEDRGVQLGFMWLRQILEQYNLLTMQERTQYMTKGLAMQLQRSTVHNCS